MTANNPIQTKRNNLKEAAEFIDAERTADGRWVYWAAETQTWWAMDDDDLELLHGLLTHEDRSTREEAYSRWCGDPENRSADMGHRVAHLLK